MPIYTAAQRLLKSTPPFHYNLAARYFLTNLRVIENRIPDEGRATTIVFSRNLLIWYVCIRCGRCSCQSTDGKCRGHKAKEAVGFTKKNIQWYACLLNLLYNLLIFVLRSLRPIIRTRQQQQCNQPRSFFETSTEWRRIFRSNWFAQLS